MHYRDRSDRSCTISDNNVEKKKKKGIVLLIQSLNTFLLAMPTSNDGVTTKILPVSTWLLLISTFSCMLRQIRVLP